MTAIEYGLLTALASAVGITAWTWTHDPKPSPVAFAMSVGTSTATYGQNIHGITCLADGRAWPARPNGMCFLSDKPK